MCPGIATAVATENIVPASMRLKPILVKWIQSVMKVVCNPCAKDPELSFEAHFGEAPHYSLKVF